MHTHIYTQSHKIHKNLENCTGGNSIKKQGLILLSYSTEPSMNSHMQEHPQYSSLIKLSPVFHLVCLLVIVLERKMPNELV